MTLNWPGQEEAQSSIRHMALGHSLTNSHVLTQIPTTGAAP